MDRFQFLRAREGIPGSVAHKYRFPLVEARAIWKKAVESGEAQFAFSDNECRCWKPNCIAVHYRDLWPDEGGDDYIQVVKNTHLSNVA